MHQDLRMMLWINTGPEECSVASDVECSTIVALLSSSYSQHVFDVKCVRRA